MMAAEYHIERIEIARRHVYESYVQYDSDTQSYTVSKMRICLDGRTKWAYRPDFEIVVPADDARAPDAAVAALVKAIDATAAAYRQQYQSNLVDQLCYLFEHARDCDVTHETRIGRTHLTLLARIQKLHDVYLGAVDDIVIDGTFHTIGRQRIFLGDAFSLPAPGAYPRTHTLREYAMRTAILHAFFFADPARKEALLQRVFQDFYEPKPWPDANSKAEAKTWLVGHE